MEPKKHIRIRWGRVIASVLCLAVVLLAIIPSVRGIRGWFSTASEGADDGQSPVVSAENAPEGTNDPADPADPADTSGTPAEAPTASREVQGPAPLPGTVTVPADSQSDKVCYLTFDDGPSDNTPKILDILDQYNAKATFFVIGASKTEYMHLITERGQTIALHSNTHDWSIYDSTDAYFRDLQAISDLVYEKTGVRSSIIRFPGGSSNTVSRKHCAGIMTELTQAVEEKGYAFFDWDIDSEDAKKTRVPAATLIQNIKSYDYSQRKSICVLFHDAPAKTTTVEALPEILEHLSAQGYRFEGLKKTSPEFHHGVNN